MFKVYRKKRKIPLHISHRNYSSPSQRDAVIWNDIPLKPKQLLVSLRVCNIRTPRIGNSGCSWCELLETKKLPEKSDWNSVHIV